MANVKFYMSGMLGVEKGKCYLPHSCDRWIIGDRSQAALLMDDLNQFLNGYYEPDEDRNFREAFY